MDQHAFMSAVTALKAGDTIAYPTEAVYGLGCDPFNEMAVKHLVSLKQRPIEQGLILIAADWKQVKELTQPIDNTRMETIQASWPGAITWLFPASHLAPTWITGAHNTIALRVTAHPIARQLCEQFAGPIVSTSANPTGQTPAKTITQVITYFECQIKSIVPGEIGLLDRPTPIKDAITDEEIRI